MSQQMLADLQAISPELWLTATIVVTLVADLVWGHRGHLGVVLFTLVGSGFALASLGASPEAPERAFGLLVHDGHAHFFRALILGGTLLSVLFASVFRGLEGPARNEFYPVLLSAGLGGCLLVSTDHLLMIVLGMELLSLPSYILAGWQKRERRSSEAAMKYLVYGALSSGLMLFGFSLLYGLTGQLDLSGLGAGLMHRFQDAAEWSVTAPGAIVMVLGVVLALAGFGFKVAMVPFHFWAPDVYEGAPTPVTTFLAVVSKAAGFGVLTRFVSTVLLPGEHALHRPEVVELFSVLFAVLAAVTMTYGNVTAVLQRNAKRLLAYSSIAHAGYLLMGLAIILSAADGSHAREGADALLFYLATYYVATIGAFGCVMALSNRFGAEDTEDYRGLGWSAPWIGGALVVFLVSLTGLPPTIGFAGKLWLFKAALGSGLGWLALVAAINAVVSLFYYFKLARALFLRGEPEVVAGLPSRGLLAGLATATLGVIAAFTFALWWFRFDGLAAWVERSLL